MLKRILLVFTITLVTLLAGCSTTENKGTVEISTDETTKENRKSGDKPDYSEFIDSVSDEYPALNIDENKVDIIKLIDNMDANRVLKEFEDMGIRFYIDSGIDGIKLGMDGYTSDPISIDDLDKLGIKSYNTTESEYMTVSNVGVKSALYTHNTDGSISDGEGDINVKVYDSLKNSADQSLYINVTVNCKGDITIGEERLNIDSIGNLELAESALALYFNDISVLAVDDIEKYDHYLKASTYHSSDDGKAYVFIVTELKYKDDGTGVCRLVDDNFRVVYEYGYKPGRK